MSAQVPAVSRLVTRSKFPDWLAGFLNAPRYRLRAFSYGLRIVFARPAFELVRFAMTAAGVLMGIGFGIGKTSPHLSLATWGAIAVGIAVLAYPVIRYLSNLSRIMSFAASSEDGAARIQRDMALGMRNDLAYGQLIELYRPVVDEVNLGLAQLGVRRRFELVEMEGEKERTERYAAACLPVEGGETLEGLFGHSNRSDGKWSPERFRTVADSRQRLMGRWRERSKESMERSMEDEGGDNYCMTKLIVEANAPLRMQVGVATYGEIVRSCDALINEFALFGYLTGPLEKRGRLSALGRGPLRMSPARMLRRLPWRNRIHKESRARPLDFRLRRLLRRKSRPAADLFLQPRDRAAGIGVAVATLDKKGRESERVYLGMRSGIVGTYPSTNHVVPAGMCNTNGTDFGPHGDRIAPGSDYLRTAMRCEFLEEWLGEKELESNRGPDWRARVSRKWEKRLHSDGRDSPLEEDMRLTGVAFDLLNLRPEVCATAVIDTSDGELNWEFDRMSMEPPLWAVGGLKRTEIVQSGAAALKLAQLSRVGLAPPPRERVG